MAVAHAMASSLSLAMRPSSVSTRLKNSLSLKSRAGVRTCKSLGGVMSHGRLRLSSTRRSLEVSASAAPLPHGIEGSSPKAVNFSRNFFLVLELVARSLSQMGERLRDAVEKPQTQEELQLLTALKGRMVCAAAPILFAAISQSVNTPLTVIASGMAKWLELYSGVLMVRVLLSWFPNIPWERQPLQAMRDMCDPYLNLFRNIIPPLFNALDLSPMLAFLVLGVLTSILNTTVQTASAAIAWGFQVGLLGVGWMGFFL